MRNSLIAASLALSAGLALLACTTAQLDQAKTYQAQIAGACAMAVPLAGFVPAVGVYVMAACSTEQAIAKLALDPSSLQWLQGLVAKLKSA